MKNRKAISATIILILLWSLFGLISSVSYAENIPISEEGLEKIGLNKIRLEGGIGVIVFNLSEPGDRLVGDGYLTVSNTYNKSVTIYCRRITTLSPVDLDKNRSIRIHPKISDFIYFYPAPDKSWVTMEDNKATINPYSIYNFNYTVDIPLKEKYLLFFTKTVNFSNTSRGYLTYINIFKKDVSGATGMVIIGIDYNYKIFLVFTGEQEQGTDLSQWMTLSIPFIFGGLLFVFHRWRMLSLLFSPMPIAHASHNENKKPKKEDIAPDIICTNESTAKKPIEDNPISYHTRRGG